MWQNWKWNNWRVRLLLSRLEREAQTIEAMIKLFCRLHNHVPDQSTSGDSSPQTALCSDCYSLLTYALKRLQCCPFGEEKPACSKCKVHCYKPEMREEVRKVMRWSGPRMLFHHPIMTFWHFVDKFRSPSKSKKSWEFVAKNECMLFNNLLCGLALCLALFPSPIGRGTCRVLSFFTSRVKADKAGF